MDELRDIFVEVTNCCYQKCMHCSSCAEAGSYPEISLTDLKKIVSDALPLGLKNIVLSGGEPFVYPNLLDAVDFFYENRIATSIYTCGIIKNTLGILSSIDEKLFWTLKKRNLHKIIFSLHGSKPEIQDKIANIEGSFNLVMKSLENALKAGLHVELHVVPMHINLNDLENILRFAEDKGIHHVSFLRFVPQGRGNLAMEPTRGEYLILKQKYEQWKEKFNSIHIRFGTPYNCLTFEGKQCTAGKNKILINAHGEYFPCEAFKFMRGQRPTIYDTNIKTVWEKDALLNDLRKLRIEDISVCNSCTLNAECQGGCAGQRLQRNGSLTKGPDPSCLL